MTITAIDPGTHESAILTFDGSALTEAFIVPNSELMHMVRNGRPDKDYAIEMIASYGMAVGAEVFETCLLIGRLQEAIMVAGSRSRLVYRKDVKMHLCHSMRAKDPNIRMALIDKYGAVGTSKNRGPLYGIKSHLWSALAIADYALSNPG